jgi:hypothetical protein
LLAILYLQPKIVAIDRNKDALAEFGSQKK